MDQELRELLKQIIDDPKVREAREKAFKEKDAQKYGKYWFGKHEDIGVFYNETSFSKN